MKPPIDDRPNDALLEELDATTLMLGRQMAARHSQLSEGMPLSSAQLLLMFLLEHGGPQRAGDLAAALGVKAPAMTATLDALEKDGYIRREHATGDRRVITITLTDSGAEVLGIAKSRRREHMRVLTAGLDTADVEALIRIQRRIIDALMSPST